MAIRGELYSKKVFVGKRSYFFNVKENRNGDVFLNIVESKKTPEEIAFQRHSILVFEEDVLPFMEGLNEALDELKKATAASTLSSRGRKSFDGEDRDRY